MEINEYIKDLCERANNAKGLLARASTQVKNSILESIADKLVSECESITKANSLDLSLAEENGVPKAMLDRLMLNEIRIKAIADSLHQLAGLEDPIGSGTRTVRPNGLVIEHIKVPLGVVAIIYEARPNVTVDAAALCIKTGNAVILRGGKEAINTNRRLAQIMKSAVEEAGISPDAVGFVDNTSREGSAALMKMRGLVDLLVPRGGKGLIKSVVENATVPVIETGAGNCHIFVDESACIDKAVNVAVNAKLQRPSVCNAVETMLIHKNIANEFLPEFVKAVKEYGKPLEIRGCERTQKIIPCSAAESEDWETEYDDYILAVKIVDSVDEAISHINKYNTKHSETIITQNMKNAERFQSEIDAAAVYVNASTRFTDGGEFGFGAELGISTQKLHARGPMGLFALTTDKYLIKGDGHIR